MEIKGFSSNFSELDIQFARFLERLSGKAAAEVFMAAALASASCRQGHICLNLSSMAGKAVGEGEEAWSIPELDAWLTILGQSPVIGKPGDFCPLVLEETRLYLYRYWDYERKLAQILTAMAEGEVCGIDAPLLGDGLRRLFPEKDGDGVNWQKVAAFASVWKRLCLISGGPGTGKTFTVAKIIALHLEQSKGKPLRIALTSPTGKAAARLRESIHEAKGKLDGPKDVIEAIPEEASTIHRLLGALSGSPYFRHNPENPLPVDLLVVDESSMVDLALLSKLAQAVPKGARLILLGDKDQLASVEAGAVLGDICEAGQTHSFSAPFSQAYQKITGEELGEPVGPTGSPGIQDSIVELRKSYRFGPQSGIGAVSRAVNEGDGDRALTLMKKGGFPDISWKDLPHPEAMKDHLRRGFPHLKALPPAEALERFAEFRILSPLREGPYGTGGINLLVEEILEQEGLIRKDRPWYRGRPILIAKNDYQLRLFNGDVGIILPDPQNQGELRAFFSSEEGVLRRLPPLRLPEHETVYAMTVHKSQGSEFDRVLILLPSRDAPLLTRELIYTGITRAKQRVEIWGKEDIFRAAISRRIERTSGLRDRLQKWGHPIFPLSRE